MMYCKICLMLQGITEEAYIVLSETSNYSSSRFIQGCLLHAPNVREGVHKAEATQGDWSSPYIWHVNLENGWWSCMLRGWGFGSYWTFVEQKHWTFSMHMTCAFLQPWKFWTSVYVLDHRRASSLLVRIITYFIKWVFFNTILMSQFTAAFSAQAFFSDIFLCYW